MRGFADIVAPAVIPILPAVPSLLVVLTLGGSALIAGVWSLRHPAARRLLWRCVWSQRWSLVSLAAVASVSVAALAWLRNDPASAGASTPFVVGDWPHRGGLSRAGVLAGSPSPAVGRIQWTAGQQYSFLASSAVVGERIYNVGFLGDRGRLFCWDAHIGRQLWTSAPRGMRATFSSPVLAGDFLVVGEGLHRTRDASVFCLDVQPGREGEVLWSFKTHGHIESTPVIDGGRVYVNSGDDGIYCLALDPDVADADRLVWHAPGSRYPDVETSLAVHDGRVYAGLGIGGDAIAVLNADDGSELTRLPLPYPVYSPPAIGDGRLYVGAGTGDYLHLDASQGCVAAIDLDTLQVVWTHELPGTVLGAIVCDAGQVLFGCADGRLYVLDTDGQRLGEWNSHDAIAAAPAVTPGMIYVVNRAGALYAVDRRDLTVRWETHLGSPGTYVSSPVVAQGHVYVGTPEDGFLCVGEAESGEKDLPPRGRILWSWRVDGVVAGAPGVSGSTILLPVFNAASTTLLSLANRGTEPPEVRAKCDVGRSPWNELTVRDDLAVIANDEHLMAFDAPTATVLWSADVALPHVQGHVHQILVDRHIVWTCRRRQDSEVTRWTPYSIVDGSPRDIATRSAPAPRPAELVVHEQHLVVRPGAGDEVFVWADCAEFGPIVAGPVIYQGRAYVVTRDQLVCLGAAGAE